MELHDLSVQRASGEDAGPPRLLPVGTPARDAVQSISADSRQYGSEILTLRKSDHVTVLQLDETPKADALWSSDPTALRHILYAIPKGRSRDSPRSYYTKILRQSGPRRVAPSPLRHLCPSPGPGCT